MSSTEQKHKGNNAPGIWSVFAYKHVYLCSVSLMFSMKNDGLPAARIMMFNKIERQAIEQHVINDEYRQKVCTKHNLQ